MEKKEGEKKQKKEKKNSISHITKLALSHCFKFILIVDNVVFFPSFTQMHVRFFFKKAFNSLIKFHQLQSDSRNLLINSK